MFSLDQGGYSARTVSVIRADFRLDGLVEHIATDRSSVPGAAAAEWRIVPDNAAHLLWQLETVDGLLRRRLMLVGPRRVFVDIDRSRRLTTVGVRLLAGGTTSLFDTPASELCDSGWPLFDLIGAPGRALEQRLVEVPVEDVPAELTAFIADRARRARPVDRRVAALGRIACDIGLTVDDIAAKLGLSARSLRSLAGRELGMGVKRFQRIKRAHRALELTLAKPGWSWSRIAAECFYADHAHLVRDFRELLGESPSAFIARRSA